MVENWKRPDMYINRMKIISIMIFCSIILVACQPQINSEVPCAAIETLRSTVGNMYEVDEYKAWIHDNLPPNKLESIEIRPTEVSTRIGWQISNDQYFIWLEDGILTYASIDFYNELPVQLYVDGIGEPEYYEIVHSIDHGLRYHEITLYYPSLGFKISGHKYTRSRKFPLYVDVKELPINRMAIVPTQDLDQFLEYIYGSMLEGIDTTGIKPWPGSWDEVIVDIE